jgi:hypothetical protein
MKSRGSRRLVKWLGLALAAAALAAPSAQAARPLDESMAFGPVAAGGVHASLAKPPVSSPPSQPTPLNSSESSGLDRRDITIGAGIALFLMGFGALIVAARHTRRGRLAAL